MIRFIPVHGSMYEVPPPTELGVLQNFVGGLVRFVDVGNGEHLVCHEVAEDIFPKNVTASSLFHRPLHGPVVLLQMKDLL